METAAMKFLKMLTPWKESYNKPRQCIKKQRHQKANKGPYSQSYGFSSSHVWIWELDFKEGWALKNWWFWTFELWCWRRLLKVPWTERRSNQSILKEIKPEYSLERWCWGSSTLATWRKEPTHWKRPWWWERLKAGGDGDDRGWDGWMASPTQWTWVWARSGRWWRREKPDVMQSMGSHDLVTEQQQKQGVWEANAQKAQTPQWILGKSY